ncbi:MAG: Crp/Fnr family transcriptional regulator [Bacteroidetes bacterium]|nr:Crp/Fnr family transcriptional regulator [Bacteroidota bacterium]
MEQALAQLKQVTDAVQPLSAEAWADFAAIWEPYTAKRKEVITLQGSTEKYLYFVTEGVQRIYYFDEQEREATIIFTYAPSFGGVLDSLLMQQPSKYYCEALTASTFIRAKHSDLQRLMLKHKEIETLIRQGVTSSLSGVLERLVELQCFSSEEKFRKLLQRSPHILQMVPHKYLANYLGIDATNFSKLINKVKI